MKKKEESQPNGFGCHVAGVIQTDVLGLSASSTI